MIVTYDGMVTISPSSLAGGGDCPWIHGVAGRVGTAPAAASPHSCQQPTEAEITPRTARKVLTGNDWQWLSPGHW
jgi:hypothetical protein